MSETALRTAHRFSVAPMLDWTDQDCRYFLRLISRHALLYTEMVTTGALIHGDRVRFLGHHDDEEPVALQLGGVDPRDLALCARLGEQAGFNEINLNVGCPSDRVQSGAFGACLMKQPHGVATCVAAMREAVQIPVSVKTRLGVDELDSDAFVYDFVGQVAEAGCEIFIIHARKAWLNGLSPKENRDIPPLEYERVYQLKQDFPHLHIDLNGGVKTLDEVRAHLQHVDGVMMGREAYHNPYILAEVDRAVFADPHPVPSRHEIVRAMLPYISQRMQAGRPLKSISRHLLGLFQGQPGARAWRRHLSEHAHRPGADIHVLKEALALVPESGSFAE